VIELTISDTLIADQALEYTPHGSRIDNLVDSRVAAAGIDASEHFAVVADVVAD